MLKRHPKADCENCTMFTEDAVFMPTQMGSVNDVVVISEAPGFRAVAKGRPIPGPRGALLDAVLSSHGLNRDRSMVTTTVLCRTPDEHAPTKAEIACCSARLKDEIEASGAKTIITLGNTAANAILDRDVKVTSVRVGPPKESPLYPGIKVIPTLDPAYVIRVPDSFPQFVGDIGKVNSNVGQEWNPPTYRVFDTVDDAKTALRELFARLNDPNARRLVIDIEVGVEKDTDFDHPDQYQMLCVGIGYAKRKVAVIGECAIADAEVRDLLRDLLEDSRSEVSAHNGKFDLAGLRPLGIKAKLHFDTMLASYALDERSGVHGLKYLAVEKLGAPQYDLEIQKYTQKGASYSNIPRDLLYKYNAYDVSCTWDLQDLQEEELSRSPELLRLMRHLIDGSSMLQEAEMSGIKVDLDYLSILSKDFEKRMDNIKGTLSAFVDNPNSPKQVKEAFSKLGMEVESTDKGSMEDLLKTAKDEARDFVVKMLVWRKEAKLYGTYVKGIEKRLYKDRVHPSFLLHGTTTGRLSCRNPNLQNVPRDSSIRKMFVPESGNVFVQADYKTAELRVVCALAQDDVLAAMLSPDRDIHSEVAERFFGKGFTKDQRVRAKAVVFGLTYGRTAYDLAMEYEMTPKEAQVYLDTWFGLIPKTVAWRDSIKDSILKEQSDLVSPFGRHRRFWLITDDNSKDVVKEGLAFLPQSTASDINVAAACRLRNMGYDVKLLVHDSTLIECKESDAENTAKVMTEVMERTAADLFTDFVPFPVDVKIGYNWGEV